MLEKSQLIDQFLIFKNSIIFENFNTKIIKKYKKLWKMIDS